MADYPSYSYDRDSRVYTPPAAPITPFSLQQAGAAQLANRGVPYPLPVGSLYGASYPNTNAVAARPAAQPEPQPFNLQFAPPPALPSLPQLNVNVAGGRTATGQSRVAAPASPPALANGDLKGIPANAIPVLRGTELSYDIPGTGQRLYPTLGGGVSEYSPSERLDLARYTEPANIHAQAGIREAGIRAGAELSSARIAQQGAQFRTLAELGATPRPFGAEVVPDPTTGLGISVPTYGVPKINTASGAVEGFTPIGAAAQRAAGPREGATGTINGRQFVVKNGQRVWTDGKP